MRSRRVRSAGGALVVLALLLTGCAADPLAQDYLNGGNENYITGSGIVEIPESKRAEPIEFTGVTESGETVSRADYDGEVLVVNFWYADCPPCRAEAPDLVALSDKYRGAGASFLGINVYDGAERSLAFAREFDVKYPSILDATTGEVRLAFAGEVPPKAVPTTFVLDSQGRIAARILGQLQARSILDTLIEDVMAEDGG